MLILVCDGINFYNFRFTLYQHGASLTGNWAAALRLCAYGIGALVSGIVLLWIPTVRWIAWIGTKTLTIYLAHPLILKLGLPWVEGLPIPQNWMLYVIIGIVIILACAMVSTKSFSAYFANPLSTLLNLKRGQKKSLA